MIRKYFDFIGTPVLLGLFGALFVLESKFELRKRVQSRWKRTQINALVAAPSFVLLRIMFIPAMVVLAKKNRPIRRGLQFLLPSDTLRQMLAFMFLDYTNYLWHILNHRFPFLWRFHLVHHTDRDLDITTAFRFHFGEMVGSLFFRGACTFISGASPLTVLIYEITFEGATEFHHSNFRLPSNFEKLLNKILVTPRMHGIHHSVNSIETDSNFSVVFSFWDRLHKTLNLNVEQEKIVIGVPAYQDTAELSSTFLLKLPFLPLKS